jgi:hypothetical protein
MTGTTRNGICHTAVSPPFSSLLTAHSALFTSSNPLFSASGLATSSFNGPHLKSKFLAINPARRHLIHVRISEVAGFNLCL